MKVYEIVFGDLAVRTLRISVEVIGFDIVSFTAFTRFSLLQ